MAANTEIQWTEATWNPWHGCIKVSPGCKFCYMYRDKKRYGQDPTKVVRSKTTFTDPLKWKEPKVVFTCSWSDWFIAEADEWRPEAWQIIRDTPQHTYQILTKRPERIAEALPSDWGDGYPNVWLGVSVETQKEANERIPLLLDAPAQIRFLSVEPLLDKVTFRWALWQPWNYVGVNNELDGLRRIDWVIVGGESGKDARPMDPEWARIIRDQCAKAGVPFFMKQMAKKAPIPEDLFVRQMPITHKLPVAA